MGTVYCKQMGKKRKESENTQEGMCRQQEMMWFSDLVKGIICKLSLMVDFAIPVVLVIQKN